MTTYSVDPIIGGRSVRPSTGQYFPTINPANGTEITKVAECGAEDVDRAVKAARAAFEHGPWRSMKPAERKTLMLRFARVIEANAEELGHLEVIDAGKPVTEVMKVDLPDVVNTICWHAEAADKLFDQVAPTGDGALAVVRREPIGVVGAVLPWNFPLMMAAWKLGPILATGNTVVLKPAEQTSLSTIRLAQLASDAGIPDGVINVVTGYGDPVGKAIGLHPDVDCVTFTGSTETGRHFLRYAADSNLKRITLECGGKSPMVVMPDAIDLDIVAEHCLHSVFWNMGENCSSNTRLLVHSSLHDELVGILLDKALTWVVNDPMRPSAKIGPMIDETHMDKVLNAIAQAKADGAKLAFGGKRRMEDSGGFFVEPTIFSDVNPESFLFQEEIFGPVLAITKFETIEEGINLANYSKYGLAASVFSGSSKTALNAAFRIKAGTVGINCYSEGDASTPFGGYKLSGFGGRDKGLAAHDQYCELKTIWTDLS